MSYGRASYGRTSFARAAAGAVAPPVAGTTITPSGATLTLTGQTPAIIQPRTIAPGGTVITLVGNTPAVVQPQTLSPAGALLTFAGNMPTVTQMAPVTLNPTGALLALACGVPGVSQGAQVQPPASGGGAGPVREVRRFADLLDRARKPTRSQKKARRKALEAEALELLPDLPEAEQLAPVAARIVFEQEARALAPLYAARPIEALAPVVAQFDAHAALRDLVARMLAETELQRELDAEDEFETELLLLGS